MTRTPLDRLHTELGALTMAWAQAQPAFGGSEVEGAGQSFAGLSGPGLVRVVEGAARVKRAVEAFLARAGDEVAARSAPEFGAEGLAKQHGHASPAKLVAAATGDAPGEAARLLAVGAATRERESFTGEVLPAKFPAVRAGLESGLISVAAANLITAMLSRLELRADPVRLAACEERLVQVATGRPLSLVSRAVKAAEAQLDTAEVARTDERMHAERSVTFREDADGVFHLRARLDPVTAAPIKAALDAFVSDAFRCRGSGGSAPGGSPAGCETATPETSAGGGAGSVGTTGPADAGSGAVLEDRRSIPQLHADALAELARHALGCTRAPGSLPSTTVVVRMSLDALRDGLGVAEVDGIDRPIAAGTVRRLAADAEIIPAVLGSDSVPLDLGRGTRLFSRSQRLALMERDGGCAACGANITYAQAHHVTWWSRGGTTDLTNGVMLCSNCHHQIHDHDWDVRIRHGRVWFIPPPHLDPDQTPRLGGKARFDPNPEPPGDVGAADGAGAAQDSSPGPGPGSGPGSGPGAGSGSGPGQAVSLATERSAGRVSLGV